MQIKYAFRYYFGGIWLILLCFCKLRKWMDFHRLRF
ncbi:hypothetical protein EBL_c02500 [Shimwellia blattae DSM 4481 = NBRC 105725]|uniref:Uncharacterized protein n=1 Tax=Shimwellia blattae (strain ATCC 29907 / DSM 4481 / JCM 1650 / NBRC 105725 / CDC 9005-74) TaxID=630626 RepID=I2B4D1_SHIBC|nr:hypothetical protein EBL_c02500 [Shimwellia blattae DSM 4481 = NBRC 105725]